MLDIFDARDTFDGAHSEESKTTQRNDTYQPNIEPVLDYTAGAFQK